jgi:hypothetical protein
MVSVALTLFGLAAIYGCANPFPFGPGRIEVELENAAVQRLTRGELLPRSDPAWRDRPVDVIRFDLSSDENLARYFEDWDRLVQTRCFVEGAQDGRSYADFAVGPLQEGIDISMLGRRRNEARDLAPDSAGKYRYTVYAFLDLRADDRKYVDGKPRGTFDLASQQFSSVGCFIIGVTKAPVIFPRTNAFSLSERQVKDGISKLARSAAQHTPPCRRRGLVAGRLNL